MNLHDITEILENLEDQELAVKLLQEFNERSQHYHRLLMDKNPLIDPKRWKEMCDKAQEELQETIDKILSTTRA